MFQEMKAAPIHAFSESQSLADRSETLHSFPFVELRHSLPSYIGLVSPFIDQLMGFIAKFRRADASTFEIELALREALVNAILHGNQEDSHKRVHVKCRCTTNGEVSVTVHDEGRGFDTDAVPDPTSPDNLLRPHGRGIYLMKTLMDEVHFEQSGSIVHMRKRANDGPDATRKPQ